MTHDQIFCTSFTGYGIVGVIPLTQGFKLNEPLKLNLFKDKAQAVFGLSQTLTQSAWEQKRDRGRRSCERNDCYRRRRIQRLDHAAHLSRLRNLRPIGVQ